MIDFLQISTTSTGGLVIGDLDYIQNIFTIIVAIYSMVLDQSRHVVDLNRGGLSIIIFITTILDIGLIMTILCTIIFMIRIA